MTVEELLSRLDRVKQAAHGWQARCPAHTDRSPSLSIREGERGVLVHCFAGCSVREVCAALSLELKDLFSDTPLPQGQRPAPRPAKVDRVALAFQFDLGALDLRLRAEGIIEAGKKLDVANLSDRELDHALIYTAQAHADVERAELFEHVADTLRMKEFTERDHGQQRRVA